MKKIFVLSIVFLALANFAHASTQLFGFLDGSFYDQNQTLKYICFMDDTCLSADNKLYLRSDILTSQNPQPYTPPIVFGNDAPISTAPVVTVPVQQTVVAGQPSCNLTATDTGGYNIVVSWTTQNITGANGRLFSANRYISGVPDFSWGNVTHDNPIGGSPILVLPNGSRSVGYAEDYKAMFGDVTCYAKLI